MTSREAVQAHRLRLDRGHGFAVWDQDRGTVDVFLSTETVRFRAFGLTKADRIIGAITGLWPDWRRAIGAKGRVWTLQIW